ncbi:MAG: 5'/3'-nucleotidase SurE [Armatimonadetes bacterium]|nr:5'/3'-nucleotidase SurE [Armatimonadota bacterium]
MRILITNDDGVHAPGLRALVSELTSLGEVVVFAPEREQSCSGHAITLHKPLRIRDARIDGADVRAYSVSGTPADCVVLGCLQEKEPFDLVLSGINAGANLGEEVFYSGTVAAAMEASLHGIRSVAMSVTAYRDCDFRAAAQFATRFGPACTTMDLPPDTVLNVNVPSLPPDQIRGVRVTRLGRRSYENFLERREDPRGVPYYWFSGEAREADATEDTDIGATQAGFISVTPMRFDITAYEAMGGIMSQLSAMGLVKP